MENMFPDPLQLNSFSGNMKGKQKTYLNILKKRKKEEGRIVASKHRSHLKGAITFVFNSEDLHKIKFYYYFYFEYSYNKIE